MMDAKLANTWRMTVNEKKFIETALESNLRIDGRNPLEFRNIIINFGREDGSSDVQLGKTRVMGFVTAQLVQPYRDRPNEGSLSIFTEFSPMADPAFEPGRPGQSAVELGRVVDRGLRESMAVDTESLCVLAGKLVWAIRIDLHVIDNGGNLVDAANVAAMAALLTFRKPECTLGDDGQEVIVHPQEVKEPLPLIIHHLPIAVTFAFFGSDGKMVVDPTHNEEAVMVSRMTVTANANGDICAIQKAGGEGVPQSVILHCLHLASLNAESITKKIKTAVEVHNTERALHKIKRHSTSISANVNVVDGDVRKHKETSTAKEDDELSRHRIERLKLVSEETSVSQSNGIDDDNKSSTTGNSSRDAGITKNFLGGPSSWDPYSKGVDSDFLKASLAWRGPLTSNRLKNGSDKITSETEQDKLPVDTNPTTLATDASGAVLQASGEKTLKDAVKPKNKRKKASSGMNKS